MFLARVINVVFILAGVLFFYLYVMPLKRIEMGENAFVVTNYFKNYQYTYDSIESIKERDWFFFRIYTIILKETGSFGRRINFVGSKKRFSKFREAHPENFVGLYQGI